MLTRFLTRLCLLIFLTSFGSGALQACGASKQLAELGRTYDSLLGAQSQSDWRTGAARLSDTLTTSDAVQLGRDLGLEGAPADITRIARLFADASALLNSTWSDRDRHTGRALVNFTYIDRLVSATGCDAAPVKISQPGQDGETDANLENERDHLEPPTATVTKALWSVATALALGLMATATFLATRKKTSNLRHSERLIRYPAVIPVLVTIADTAPELADTADISMGGVRLAWANPPPASTAISIDFGDIESPAQVIWSNAYFAGARFDATLSETDLDAIRHRNNTP